MPEQSITFLAKMLSLLSPFIWKITGAAAGALFALFVDPPKTLKGAASRGFGAASSGFVFGPFLVHWAGVDGTNPEIQFAAWCFSSAVGWGLFGLISRLIRELTIAHIIELANIFKGKGR